MEALLNLLKVFLEKHLFPTIISMTAALIGYCATPDNYIYLQKLGRDYYIFLLGGIAFINIELLLIVFNFIRNFISRWLSKQQSQKYSEEKFKERLQVLWDEIDSYDASDRKMLMQLITNGNQPIEIRNYNFKYKSILNSNLLKKRDLSDANEYLVEYKIDDQIYEVLKYSLDVYGKIGNFKEES